MQLFTCKTRTTHFIFISYLTLCTAPSEGIVQMPWIPLNSGSIMGPWKSKMRGQNMVLSCFCSCWRNQGRCQQKISEPVYSSSTKLCMSPSVLQSKVCPSLQWFALPLCALEVPSILLGPFLRLLFHRELQISAQRHRVLSLQQQAYQLLGVGSEGR